MKDLGGSSVLAGHGDLLPQVIHQFGGGAFSGSLTLAEIEHTIGHDISQWYRYGGLSNLVSHAGNKPADVLALTDGASGSTLSAKIDGHSFDIVKLDGVHGHTLHDLLASGAILS